MKRGIAKYPKPDPNHKKNVKLVTNTQDKSLFGNSTQTIPIENSFISEGNPIQKFPTNLTKMKARHAARPMAKR